MLKFLRHATVRSHFWHGTDENAIYVYYYFIHLSLSSRFKYNFIFMFSHSFSASPSPLSHTLFFSLLLFSASRCHLSLSHTPFNFLSTISQIPPSLIYKIRFTGFFSPFFPLFFTLSSLFYDLIHQISLVHLKVADSKFNMSHHRFPLYHLTNSTITDLQIPPPITPLVSLAPPQSRQSSLRSRQSLPPIYPILAANLANPHRRSS